MTNELIQSASDFLFCIFVCICFGYVSTLCLYEVLDSLKIVHYKQGKIKCWIYLSLFALGLYAFLYAFSQR